MLTALRKRLDAKSEQGFTLIELLVVIIIIGILLAIAVPRYLGFQDRANKAAAQANVRSAIPSIETFYADNNTYVGVENRRLRRYDPRRGNCAISYDAGLIASFDATKKHVDELLRLLQEGQLSSTSSSARHGVDQLPTRLPTDAVHCV